MSRKSGLRFPACAEPWYPFITWRDASAGEGRSEQGHAQRKNSAQAADGASGMAMVFSASATTCMVRKMLEGLTLIESMPRRAR